MKINPKNKKPLTDPDAIPSDLVHLPPSRTDPEGWYSARPDDPDKIPVQDVDDL